MCRTESLCVGKDFLTARIDWNQYAGDMTVADAKRRTPRLPRLLQQPPAPLRHRHGDSQRTLRYPAEGCLMSEMS